MNIGLIDQYWLRIREGDEKALESLFKDIYSPLCRYAGQITGDSFLAEELVQDVFHKIWQSRDVIIITSSFKAYLFQAVRNHSLNAIRKNDSKRFSFTRQIADEAWNFLKDTYESDDYIVERIAAGETEKAIEQAIESLSPQCRSVFKMNRFENKSPGEIAGQLNISVNTVRSHIYTALLKISEYLKKEN